MAIKTVGEDGLFGEEQGPKQKILDGTNKDAVGTLIVEKQEESKEVFVKSLEFENDVMKIDNLPFPNEEWKKETRGRGFGSVKVNIAPTGDNTTGNIIEIAENASLYMDMYWKTGWLMRIKGIQMFTYSVFLDAVMKHYHCSKEEAEQKYMMTEEELKEKMKKFPNDSLSYKQFFYEEIAPFGTGVIMKPEFVSAKSLENIISDPGVLYIWLSKGSVASFGPKSWDIIRGGNLREGGSECLLCCGRLLKEIK